MSASRSIARSVWAAAEPFTLWGLFRPGATTALQAHGIDARATYLVCRAAPLGATNPAVVVAAFRSLPAGPILAAFPRIWGLVSPADALNLTHDAVERECQELFADVHLPASPGDIAALLDGLVDGLDVTGRPLGAAGRSVPSPDAPWAAVWRHLTTLREYRGDAHVAALVTADLDLVETEVLMAAWAGDRVDVPLLRTSRAISDDAWQQAEKRLCERSLLDDDGGITADGTALREHLEDLTDRASAAPWRTVAAEQVEMLRSFATQVSALLIERGRISAVTPVGAPWPPPH